MQWLEILIEVPTDELDVICERLESKGIDGLVIGGEIVVSDFFQLDKNSWDYVDDDALSFTKGICSITFYLEDSETGQAKLSEIKPIIDIFRTKIGNVKDEDWENNWRAYYNPIKTGQRLIVVPSWIYDYESDGRVVLKMDPKNVFGTGDHSSTKMCLAELEKYNPETALDLGCGSGILSVAALLLGCKYVDLADISPNADAVAKENAFINGIAENRFKVHIGDILSADFLKTVVGGKKYDMILANIVADVIISAAPRVLPLLSDGGVFICSGIIDGRQSEVSGHLRGAGFDIVSSAKIDNFHCMACIVNRAVTE